ncbi:MAG: hypothetical protein D6769_03390 [Methanobacteriota archaeon]|nr:MAG: hypothetical protein D6769_03390 [Euryarchaeota archaeon]
MDIPKTSVLRLRKSTNMRLPMHKYYFYNVDTNLGGVDSFISSSTSNLFRNLKAIFEEINEQKGRASGKEGNPYVVPNLPLMRSFRKVCETLSHMTKIDFSRIQEIVERVSLDCYDSEFVKDYFELLENELPLQPGTLDYIYFKVGGDAYLTSLIFSTTLERSNKIMLPRCDVDNPFEDREIMGVLISLDILIENLVKFETIHRLNKLRFSNYNRAHVVLMTHDMYESIESAIHNLVNLVELDSNGRDLVPCSTARSKTTS